jgi:hypothetical protein
MTETRTGEDARVDRSVDQFLARAARENGETNGHFLSVAGIVSPALASRVKRHEVSTSALPERVQSLLADRTDWHGDHPGGPVVASIIDNGKVAKRVDMPKRRRGRPVKHFVRGDDAGTGE